MNEPVARAAAAPIDVRNPRQVVSIVVAGDRAYLGLSTVAFNLSAWAGGERRFAREEGQISRAEFKLLEALEVFGLTLPATGDALDLGAAPGGWSRVLAARGLRVTAVDPAALARNLAGVTHERTHAQAFLHRAGRYDVLAADLRMDARSASHLLSAYAPHLNGIGLTTLKLPREGGARVLTEALRLLRGAYDVTGARQLFHNRSEVTVALARGR